MKVNLISYSKDNIGDKNLEQQIAFCARVSNPANQLSQERDDTKLIQYLIRNNHWSPFEMVSICLEIHTTRDIARQILRHRSFSFQEFSQRYAVVSGDGEYKEARLQDAKNRQNSIETNDKDLQAWWFQKQDLLYKESQRIYEVALEMGLAKEVARSVLPEGLTPSTMYMNGTLRSWIHYIQLRTGHGTQKEHKEIALACAKSIETVFPSINNFVTKENI